MLELSKPGIDLGVIMSNPAEMIAFYLDVLGLDDEGETPMPGGGTMRRVRCGDSLLKLITRDEPPAHTDPGGGIVGSTGLRYFTIGVANLEAAHDACEAAGATIIMPPVDMPSGARIVMVEDPDGNWVEFLQD